MLSARDQRALDQIERGLADTYPELAAVLREPHPDPGTRTTSRYVLVVGLVLLSVGLVAWALPLALFGIVLTLFSPVLAAAGSVPTDRGRPGRRAA